MSGRWSLRSKSIKLLHLEVIVTILSLVKEVNLWSASLRVIVMRPTVLSVITVIEILSLVGFLLSAWWSLPLLKLVKVWTKLTSRACITLQSLDRILLVKI